MKLVFHGCLPGLLVVKERASMIHNAIENPQLLTLVNPGRPPARRRKKNPKSQGGNTVAKRKVYIDPETGLFISEAEAKKRGLKPHKAAGKSKKAKSRKAKSRKAASRKAASRKKSTRAKSRKAASKAKSRKAKSRKAVSRKKATKGGSKALKKARAATKKAKAETKKAKKALTKAKRQAKKAKTQAKKDRKAATKAKAKSRKAKSTKAKSRKGKSRKAASKAKSRKGTGRGKYARGGLPASAKKAARAARSGSRPHGGKAPPGGRGGYVASYPGARKKPVRGQRKAGWHWTPGYYTAYANPGELKRITTPTGYRYQYKGKFISEARYQQLKAKQSKSKSRKGKSRKSLKARSRRNPRRDSKGRFLAKGRKNPGRKPRRGGWKGTMPRRNSRGRFMRKNPGLVAGVWEETKATAVDLWKPVVGAGAGFFGARMAANVASVSTMIPESVQPYAPMLAQLLTGVAVWTAGTKVKALKEFKNPALVGVGLSIVEALVNRFAPEGIQAYAGVPDPGLGADLDVYEAALRGYGRGMGEGLNEGWADYMPGDEELLAALEAQDAMGEYIAEPLGEYIAEPLGEYIAEPLGEYVAEPLGEYVSEPLSGVEVYEAMAGGGSDSPAVGEYIAEPLSGVEVYEAMAGNATDAEIDFYLQEAGLGYGPAPAAEGIGAYGPAPAAEGIGMIDDEVGLEDELDELQDEIEELEELDELDISALGGLGLEIEALDGMGADVDIFDSGMGGPMTDQVTAMRQNVARQRSTRRAALARRLNQLKAQQRRSYATHIHAPLKGGGIFGDQNVVGLQQPQMPAPLAIDANTLRSAVATVAAAPAMQSLTGPAKAAKVYQAVRNQLGVQPSTAFRLAFREAYKQVAPTAVAQARSPRRAPAYGGPAAPGSIRPPAAARVARPSTEFQDPMQGAPMMVKPIPQAPQPEPMEEITDQWAGMVGGIFGGTIFS